MGERSPQQGASRRRFLVWTAPHRDLPGRAAMQRSGRFGSPAHPGGRSPAAQPGTPPGVAPERLQPFRLERAYPLRLSRQRPPDPALAELRAGLAALADTVARLEAEVRRLQEGPEELQARPASAPRTTTRSRRRIRLTAQPNRADGHKVTGRRIG